MKFLGAAGWGSADKLSGYLIASLPAECSLRVLAADEKIFSDVGHTSTKKICLWKSFSRKFVALENFTRAEKILSSAQLINAARVVQLTLTANWLFLELMPAKRVSG
jgi:hypothetical protein